MGAGKKILLVDDDANLRRTLGDILRAKGYEAMAVPDGATALTKADEEKPDVALIDLRLDDMSGLEVMKGIRERTPGTECVILTGHASQKTAIEAVNLGAYAYVQKPCDPDQLLVTIQRALEKREAEEEISRQAAVLDAINRVFKDALTCETEEELGKICLAAAERLTGSEFGYIGEVNPAGLIDVIAISNPGWDACKMAVSDARKHLKDMPVIGINNSTIREEKSRIVNEDEMATHPDRAGTPEGHPRVTAFLGVPLKHEGKTIGMIGLGNKKGGYDMADQEAVENLAVAVVEALRSKRAEEERGKLLLDVEERYKELECVYGVAESVRKRETLDEIFMDVVALIPLGWQYPEITCARIAFEGREFASKGFRGTPWKQSADIVLSGDAVGTVEVCYLEERPVLNEGPFLEEERDLIDGIARTLGEAIERKQAEASLEEKERYYRTMLHALHEDILVIDRDYRITDVNNAALITTGHTRDQVIGKHCFEVSHGYTEPCGEHGEECKLREVLETGDFRNYQHVHMRADGSLFHADILLSPLKDENGAVTHVIEATRDITEQKRVEDALRESEGKYRTLLENLPQNIFYKDTNSVYISANENFARELGVTPDEFAGKTDYDFFPKELAEKYRADDKRVLESGNAEELDERYLRDGQERIVHTVKTPVKDKTGRTVGILGIFWDITDRKRAEEELISAKSRLEYLLGSSPAVIYSCEAYGDFLLKSVSENIFSLLGYTAEECLTDPKLFEDTHVHPDDKERLKADFQDAVAKGHGASEYRILRKDGTYRWIHGEIKLARDADGNPYEFIGCEIDITERRQAEEELKASEENFRLMVSEVRDYAIYALDPDGRVASWNEGARRIKGYRPEEIVGQHFSRFYTKKDVEAGKPDEELRKAAAHGRYEDVGWRVRKDGSQFMANVVATALRDEAGELKGFSKITMDITEQKRVEEALRESEIRFRGVFESGMIGTLFWNAEGDITDANDAFLEMIGYDRDEVLTGKARWRDMTPPEYKEQDDRALEEVAATGVMTPIEKEYIRKDGSRIPVLLGAASLPGPTLGGVAFVLDITEHKQLESQLRQSAKMDAIGQLAGGIAHDFNNQLTAIIGFGELAMQSLDADHPAREHIEQVRLAGEKSASLTRQILAFGRRQVLQPKILSLNKVLKGCEKMLRRLVGENVELVFLRSKGLRPVKIDPSQMEQVIMNLAINARDSMPRGGRLTIETANVDFDGEDASSHPGVQPGSYVMAAVSDNGCGMDEETLSHIFEPFFTTKKEEEGTGLGLSTVHGIVKQSGGHVYAYSELGKGTVIKIYIPKTDEVTESEKEEKEPAVSPKGTETILLAEDEEQVRNFVKRVLESNGYRVLAAADGEEALGVLRSHQGAIQLLMTDVVMPKMNGPELAAHAEDMRPDMKVIYLSGYAENAIARHGVLEPGTVFLQKPVTVKVLSRKVREVLDAARRPS